MSEGGPGGVRPSAIVTGAGTGIGSAIARRLMNDGYAVALVGRRPGPIEAVAEELRREGLRRLSAWPTWAGPRTYSGWLRKSSRRSEASTSS